MSLRISGTITQRDVTGQLARPMQLMENHSHSSRTQVELDVNSKRYNGKLACYGEFISNVHLTVQNERVDNIDVRFHGSIRKAIELLYL